MSYFKSAILITFEVFPCKIPFDYLLYSYLMWINHFAFSIIFMLLVQIIRNLEFKRNEIQRLHASAVDSKIIFTFFVFVGPVSNMWAILM